MYAYDSCHMYDSLIRVICSYVCPVFIFSQAHSASLRVRLLSLSLDPFVYFPLPLFPSGCTALRLCFALNDYEVVVYDSTVRRRGIVR